VCVFSFKCPACNAHVPYCHLWSVWLYITFSHYLIMGTIFEEKNIQQEMCVRILQYFSEIFLVIKRIEQGTIKNEHRSSCYSCPISMKLNFLTRFSIITKIPISWKSFQWEPCCSMRKDGSTDEQTDMTTLMVAFRNSSITAIQKNICLFRFNYPELVREQFHKWCT